MHPDLSQIGATDFSAYPWMEEALREYGTCRAHGPGDNNPRVLEYLAAVGLAGGQKGDDEAWCSAFVNWCLRRAGIPGSANGLARSWLKWGRISLTPVFGAVTVLERPPNPIHGHVSLYVGRTGRRVLLLGGNQTMREGAVRVNSVVSLASYPVHKILGYRWPANRGLPNEGRAPRGMFPMIQS